MFVNTAGASHPCSSWITISKQVHDPNKFTTGGRWGAVLMMMMMMMMLMMMELQQQNNKYQHQGFLSQPMSLYEHLEWLYVF